MNLSNKCARGGGLDCKVKHSVLPKKNSKIFSYKNKNNLSSITIKLMLCLLAFLSLFLFTMEFIPQRLNLNNAKASTTITTASELKAMVATQDYTLGADIVVTDSTWSPLSSYSGTFDGNGHTITFTKSIEACGFINTLSSSGTMQNLGVIYSAGLSYTGEGMGGIIARNSGTIKYCFAEGSFTGTQNGQDSMGFGGIAGYNNGTIENCYNKVTITGVNGSSNPRCGGIVGRNRGYIINCYNLGSILGVSAETGGIAGMNDSGTIYNCFSLATELNGDYIGGIAWDMGSVSNCYHSTIVEVDSSWSEMQAGIYVADLASAMSSKSSFGSSFTSGGTTYEWHADYPWDFQTVWRIAEVETAQGNMRLPCLKIFYPICEVTISVVLENNNNSIVLLNILTEEQITQQIYVNQSQNILLEMDINQEVSLVVSKPFLWRVTYSGSGSLNGDVYKFNSNDETHIVTITTVNNNFNNVIIV